MMKLNLDLVRALLAHIDSRPHDGESVDLSIEGYDDETVLDHVRQLDALGYLHAVAVWTLHGEVWKSVRLTWKGADFLARAGNSRAWEEARELIERNLVDDPEVTLEVLKRLLDVCSNESRAG
jgi:uncharacterized protein DUF2513